MTEGDSSMRRETMAGLLFWKRKCFEIKFEGAKRGFLSERKGEVIPCRGANDGKCTGTNIIVESLVRGIWRLRVPEAEQGAWEGV